MTVFYDKDSMKLFPLIHPKLELVHGNVSKDSGSFRPTMSTIKLQPYQYLCLFRLVVSAGHISNSNCGVAQFPPLYLTVEDI